MTRNETRLGEAIPSRLMAQVDNVRVVTALRRARRDRRLGDTEWFDVLYRVYLFALVGLIAIVVASDNVAGLLDDDVTIDAFLSRGPSIAGVVAMVALGIGLRNGADGGPVSVESADVRHLLLAPVSRRRVLLSPIVQRLRSVAFALALGFGVLGQLVARELDASRGGWAAGGARRRTRSTRLSALRVWSGSGPRSSRASLSRASTRRMKPPLRPRKGGSGRRIASPTRRRRKTR